MKMGVKENFNESSHLLVNDAAPAAPGLGRRHLVAFLAFLGMVVSYSLRFNLSVALVAMVRVNNTQSVSDNYTEDTSSSDTCPETETTSGSPQTGEFDWDAGTQGLILSSFFYGYITTQVVGGQLSQRYGGKAVFGVGLGVTALLSVLTPVLARAHVSLLVATRVLEGVAEGVTLPAMYLILSKWSPSSEKTFMASFALTGNNVGTVVATVFSGLLSQYAPDGGWPFCFYVFGGFGLLWFLAWMFLVTESPDKHPSISEAEKNYIIATAGKREKSPPTPWRGMLTSLPVWGAVVGHTCKNWVYYTLLTTLPSFFKQVLKFDISQNGIVSALPFIVMPFVEVGGSWAADKVREKRILTTTNVRKICTSLGLFLPALFLVIVGYVGCDQVVSVVILCFATGFLAFATAGACVSYFDVAPIHVGTMYGLGNTFATIPGMVSPSIVSAITDAQPYISRWRIVFFISSAVSVAGGIFYLFSCSGEQQSWDKQTYQEVKDDSMEESGHIDLKSKDTKSSDGGR